MKKLSLIIFLSLKILTCFGQSYLGTIIKDVNLRKGPNTNYEILSSIKAGSQVFIISLTDQNEFYNIIDIETNQEGFIKKTFIKIGKKIKENETGIFTPNGNISTYNPKIDIYNDTDKSLTLKLNEEVYHFEPQERKNLELQPGRYLYRASAPKVIPDIGAEEMKSNMSYTWKFYIIKRYR
ncbi:SH3 domain-containing protein [Pedobacter sp. Hv1]|uniref:SH3 domain-containing protein n=1 Tax=Pedobacter sp. Hv1 TaxID=1740090 RepID=UPI0006D8BAF8|nr:SH3 domain-containing protein [Pedobacter sp. Hv1]KQB99956.1 hypothetical protein AQF98_15730 [Pedobacter sp. Hv1]